MNQTESSQTSRSPGIINWTGYLAMTFLVALPLAVLTVRSGAWQQGLLVYAISCAGAAIVLLLAVILLLLPRFAPWRKATAKRALFAIPGTGLLLMTLAGGGNYPPIHDISTDLSDPPVFSAAEQRRGPDSNSLDIDLETQAQQDQAYPDLQTLVIERPFDEVYDQAVRVASDMGWDIYFQDRNAGVIEAVDTTAVMAFKDDVVIRLRTNAEGTLVDLRSVSRVGRGDLGANATRIREFQKKIQR